jgi:hypothetical protein
MYAIDVIAMTGVLIGGVYAVSAIWDLAHPYEPWKRSSVLWRRALRRVSGGRLGRLR